jgi:hypothetical protein
MVFERKNGKGSKKAYDSLTSASKKVLKLESFDQIRVPRREKEKRAQQW